MVNACEKYDGIYTEKVYDLVFMCCCLKNERF